jgi:hypothetical protein
LTLQHKAEQACFPWVATLDKWPCLCQEKNDEVQHTTHHYCLFQSIIDMEYTVKSFSVNKLRFHRAQGVEARHRDHASQKTQNLQPWHA